MGHDSEESKRTFAVQLVERLQANGFTHCFFVAGGNIMHLLDAVRTRLTCVPVVHEVAAGIAAENFNAISDEGRAFALVTAGPGITNAVTAVAGAWLESRELLVIGGQAKTSDIALFGERQKGMQELDGVSLLQPITKASVRAWNPLSEGQIDALVEFSRSGRPGPVFLEVPIDVQARRPCAAAPRPVLPRLMPTPPNDADLDAAAQALRMAHRPLLLLGGGLAHPLPDHLRDGISACGLPVMTSVNGSDLWSYDLPHHWGRPGMFGMRSANMLLQQADLLLAVGTRLGMQQTGFSWEKFAQSAQIVHVDVDAAELLKDHPGVGQRCNADATEFLSALLARVSGHGDPGLRRRAWLEFGDRVTRLLPPIAERRGDPGKICPTLFFDRLSEAAGPDCVLLPSSSGGTFTNFYQVFRNSTGQRILSDKALASMGYGLSAAIGAALASPGRRTILCEGDGGFAQNLQELGTVAQLGLDLTMFVMDNKGYGSIRTTQRRYFDGAYVGCDEETGLGLPRWDSLAHAYGLRFIEVASVEDLDEGLRSSLAGSGPVLARVVTDPDIDIHPKIGSRVTPTGTMESNPLHLMDPSLDAALFEEVSTFLHTREGVQG